MSVIAGNTLAAETFDLQRDKASRTFRKVRAVLEVKGELKLNADGKQVTRVPLQARGNLIYDERTLASAERRSNVRYYHQADANFKIAGGEHSAKLNDDRRLIIAETESASHRLFSPLGPLSREQLDLLDIPGSSALVDELLPAEPVEIGEKWSHDESRLATLLGLDTLTQNKVTSSLRSVEGDIAIVEMSGTASGAVRGISSDVDVKAKYNVDLTTGHVTWLAMSIQEDRAIGHAEPGLDVTARVRVEIKPVDEASELTTSSLAGLPLDYHDGATLLDFSSTEGGYRFLHARDWYVMVDRYDVAVMRLIQRGDLVSQCNASQLARLETGQHVELEAFQADIKRALANNFGEFVEASQITTDNGLRVLRAVVTGLASELPIQWNYYHISNDEGRQVAIVFTMDSKLVERFAQADDTIINTFEFLDVPEPTSANESERAASAGDVDRR